MEGEGQAAVEEGIGRKITEMSEGWWSEDVERLIVNRKMTCRKLREARKRRVAMVTPRARKEVKKAIVKEKKELRKRTVRDQRAGWY